jgi:hypothetical protein
MPNRPGPDLLPDSPDLAHASDFSSLWSFTNRKHPFFWIGLITCVLLIIGAWFWIENASAVFTALVSAALAWCF